MKILICPDSFKGTLTATQSAEAIDRGVKAVWPECETVLLPIGDGGEGTVEAICESMKNEKDFISINCHTVDALQRPLNASYVVMNQDTPSAIMEMAAASGITHLLPHERDVRRADTTGTGLMIADAYRRGIRDFVIGLGGSATCDGGYGAYTVLKKLSKEFGFPDDGVLLPDATFTLLCDVENPLCDTDGKHNGAAAVFGPQKGAAPADIIFLEKRNRELARLYKPHRGMDITHEKFCGAAGGLGGMLGACCNATLIKGIDEVLRIIGFNTHLENCNLIITGEGRLDTTTLAGKAPMGILKSALVRGIPVAAIGGSVRDTVELKKAGFDFIKQATPEEALSRLDGDTTQYAAFVEKAASGIMNEYLRINQHNFNKDLNG